MNDSKAKHKHESNSLPYLPVGKGGKGRQELETLYKTTKIKTAHYLTVSAAPHVQLMSTFRNVKEKKSLRSIVKDATIFEGKLDLNIEYNRVESKTTIKTRNSIIEGHQPQPKHLKTIFRKKPNFQGIFNIPVQQQMNASDCGVFAIAYATCLVYGQNPCTVIFDIPRLHQHLHRCLRAGMMQLFPTT